MSDITTTTITPTGAPSGAATSVSPSGLVTDHGKTSIASSVGGEDRRHRHPRDLGVHNMGSGASRAVGAIKDKLGAGSPKSTASQGVSVEVGGAARPPSTSTSWSSTASPSSTSPVPSGRTSCSGSSA
jgi:hypothetical protein